MRALIAACLLVSFAGCATSSSTRTARSSTSGDIDTEKMASVETEARWRGVRVYWVHPPRKP